MIIMLGYLAYASVREGGVARLLDVEHRTVCVPWGATLKQIEAVHEKNGWFVLVGLEKQRLGCRYVTLARLRCEKYIPLRWLGIRPE
jgi:hypothetical protein